ncbi:ATP synthase F0 subunit C [Candidatus Dependentiae bacterium]|nr:ATP synthase F0 subunit C [Candidatus Dependentiae bacterium]
MVADVSTLKIAAYIGAAFVMGIGTIGPALGQGLIGSKACENIGKYPESSGRIRTLMIVAMAFIETSAIYALLIAVILIFAV